MPDTLSADLFAGFDPALIAALHAEHATDQAAQGVARATATRTRHELRRANAEKQLVEILPAQFPAGAAWHVISRGDIDALSYLQHALAGVEYFDRVLVSTWCMAAADVAQLRAWLDSGRIEQLDLCFGEIFPSQYGDEYQSALDLVPLYGARVVVARNHSKIILASCAAAATWLVMESSANVNTNPRIEQTTITHDRALYDFYLEFFDGLRSIDRSAR